MPLDELIHTPRVKTTRAITIQAPPQAVWPWIVQIGYGRAGWYSYDFLEQAVGAGDFVEGGSAQRIVPELQNLKVGDVIPAAPAPYLGVVVQVVEPPTGVERSADRTLIKPDKRQDDRSQSIGAGRTGWDGPSH
jgi:hypothetical protein